MKYKESTPFMILGILPLILICTFVIWFIRSGGQTLNDVIPDDKRSAKELVELAKPYVDKYWKNRSYSVGKIRMHLDENHEGKVEIWYKDERRNKNDVPNIITVEINTKEKIITRISSQERSSKVEPEEINIGNLNIDSRELIDIAKNEFEDLEDLNYKDIYIWSSVEYGSGTGEGKEIWHLGIYNTKSQRAYILLVDVYTGEIYR